MASGDGGRQVPRLLPWRLLIRQQFLWDVFPPAPPEVQLLQDRKNSVAQPQQQQQQE